MRWLFVGVIALNLAYFGWRLAAPDVPSVEDGAGDVAAHGFPAPLELLSEGAGGRPGTAAMPAMSGTMVEGCPALGPWASTEEARLVARAVTAAGQPASARHVDLKGVAVYWVYLPPLADRALAMRKLRELQAKGMDSFVVAGGADANAISLGSFTGKDSALGVQARLRGAGYTAEIREQRRDVQQIWVVMQDPAAQGYLEHVPADLRDRARQQRLPCN